MLFNVVYASDGRIEYPMELNTIEELMNFIKDVKHDVIVSQDCLVPHDEKFDGEIMVYDDYIE